MHVSSLPEQAMFLKRGPALLLTMALMLGLALLLALQPLALPDNAPALALPKDFGQLPLSFVPNAGQSDAAVHFEVRDTGGTILFKAGEATLALPATAGGNSALMHVRFEGANPEPTVVGTDRLPGVVNYFLGNDPASWYTNLPTYGAVVYQGLYPGIDLRYEGISGRLKGTYAVAPGADPSAIRWRHAGATDVRLDAATGDLLITLPGEGGRTLVEKAPVAWQEINGQRVPVESRYTLAQDGSVSFALGSYDAALPLTIDPTLSYGTYFGGSGIEQVADIALDGDGNVYVVGSTPSTDFPTAGAYQGANAGDEDVFVLKLNATGDALVYSTYLGGDDQDEGNGIALGGDGNAYIAGNTSSTDFPTKNPLQGACALFVGTCTGDAFVTQLNASGSALEYRTYLGGSDPDVAEAIAVDGDGHAYVVGVTFSSGLFSGSFGGNADAFAAKLETDGSALVYGRYLGGSGVDSAADVAVDGSGYAYVTGETFSSNFPTASPLQAAHGGESDVFVTKLDTDGSSLLYSTYLGGDDEDYSYGIALDAAGSAYVTGDTESADFPTTTGAYDEQCGTDGNCNFEEAYSGYGFSYRDAFVAKLAADGSDLAYSTFLGGSDGDKAADVAVDSAGYAYVTGDTFSVDFPNVDPLQGYVSDSGETALAFVTKLETDASALVYSTFLGGGNGDYGIGIAVDDAGNAFVGGMTFSDDFPTTSGAYDEVCGTDGNCDDDGSFPGADGFVVKLTGEASQPLPPGPNLQGSYKAASQYRLASGETLSYTIHLVNSGTVSETADVTDTLPDEIDYVAGSANAGGVYDPGTKTVTWSDVTVEPGADVPLTFSAMGTTVATPTVVVNQATITTDDDTLERMAAVLLLPESPFVHQLFGSRKLASQHYLAPDGELTYTIWLHNSGTVSVTADVTDPVPAELDYVAGSVTEGGVYDAGTETLTWSDVQVPAGESLSLSFAVEPAGTVAVPTPVINTATIASGDESFERYAKIVLIPEEIPDPGIPPVVHNLVIEGPDVLTERDVTLYISATDDVDVRWMYLKEWQLATTPWPHWELVQSSGWVPYASEYEWTLGSESGVHFVGVWVADDKSNVSWPKGHGLDFASLLLPDETVGEDGLVPYLVHYEAGVDVTATLTPSQGDADLYVWYPDNHLWPDEKSNRGGTETDSVNFTTPKAGPYLFVVHGYTAATFDLSITPAGGTSVSALSAASGGTATQALSGKADGLTEEPVLSQSGLDPLNSVESPSAPQVIYLPIISR